MKSQKGLTLVEIIIAAGIIFALAIAGYYIISKINLNNNEGVESTKVEDSTVPESTIIKQLLIREVPVNLNTPLVIEIESFLIEIGKAHDSYLSGDSFIAQAEQYLAARNYSAVKNTLSAGAPFINRAYDIVLNAPVPNIPSSECCTSMSPDEIKNWYIDRYSCYAQWFTAAESAMDDVLSGSAGLGSSESALGTKIEECNSISSQYPSVYDTLREIAAFQTKLIDLN